MDRLKPIYTQSDFLENENPLQIESSSRKLLKFRLCFYSICLVHQITLSAIILPLDFTGSDIPHVRRMSYMRHFLITLWTNYLIMLYLPLCIYVDWHELKGLHFESKVKKLNKLRHFMFMAVINPATLYTSSIFWRIFNLDREQIVPSVFDEYVPSWMQHNLHTVPMLMCLVDLLVVPRFRPHTNQYHKKALNIFFVAYIIPSLIIHDQTGHYPYPMFDNFTPMWQVIFFTDFYLENMFFYHTQWLVTDIIWGSRLDDEIVRENTKEIHVNNSVKRNGESMNTSHKSV